MLSSDDFFTKEYLVEHLSRSLDEDLGEGDITTEQIILENKLVEGEFVARQSGVLAGIPVVNRLYTLISRRFKGLPPVEIEWYQEESSVVEQQSRLAVVRGPVTQLLAAERVALNYLQQLSGVASLTRRFVLMASVHGIKIYDTRKTVPHWRLLQKYAVACGGGYNHRFSLDSGVMIKDNHKKLAGGVKQALQRIDFPGEVVVEIHDREELVGLDLTEIDVLMLDNFSPDRLREIVPQLSGRVEVEISGGINPINFKNYLIPGVDRISLGSLTHSFESLDISFNFLNL